MVYAEQPGRLEISLYDVLGRRLGRWSTYKPPGGMKIELGAALPALSRVSEGIYFLSASFGGQRQVKKIPVLTP